MISKFICRNSVILTMMIKSYCQHSAVTLPFISAKTAHKCCKTPACITSSVRLHHLRLDMLEQRSLSLCTGAWGGPPLLHLSFTDEAAPLKHPPRPCTIGTRWRVCHVRVTGMGHPPRSWRCLLAAGAACVRH